MEDRENKLRPSMQHPNKSKFQRVLIRTYSTVDELPKYSAERLNEVSELLVWD
jgi:hypothetical protein